MLQKAGNAHVKIVGFLVSIVGFPRTSDSTNEVHDFFIVSNLLPPTFYLIPFTW